MILFDLIVIYQITLVIQYHTSLTTTQTLSCLSCPQVEQMFQKNRTVTVPSHTYPTARAELELDLVAIVKEEARRAAQGVHLTHSRCSL